MDNNLLELLAEPESGLLLENLQGGVVYSDFDSPFHLRYVTEGMAHLSGYTREELHGMSQMDLVLDEDAARLTMDVNRQLSTGDTFTAEYRLTRKDGSCVYVLDRAKVVQHRNGQKYIHCLLTDITELKEMEFALRLSEEKYKLALQQSGNVILEYELSSQTFHYSKNFSDIFGCPAPENCQLSDWLNPQDKAVAATLFRDALANRKTLPTEFLLHAPTGPAIWTMLTLMPVVLANGTVHALVGCLQNIDKAKREVQELTERSQRDGLTGVYNRVTMEHIIGQQLDAPACAQSNAMIIMDIDFFKLVNDRFGHAVGDSILIRLASLVAAQLPKSALFGRLGGDEFIIFTKTQSVATLTQLCAHITTSVCAAFANDDCPITVSLGGTLCNTAHSFRSLYRSADVALYESKNKGRNSYTVSSCQV